MYLIVLIGSASSVYIDGVGLSERAFSLIFAFNAAFTIIGPVLYIRLTRVFPVQTLVLGCYVVMVLGGCAILLLGESSPWIYAGLAGISTTAVVILRVPGANLLLEQQERDTGSAATLIHFFMMILGAAGIQIVTAHSGSPIHNLGMLFMAVGALSATLWMLVQNRPFVADKVAGTS